MSGSSFNALSRRAFLAQGGAVAALTRLPQPLFAEYEDRAEATNPVVLRFVALSDVHIKTAPQTPEPDRLRRALKFAYEYSESQPYKTCDAILVAGDMADHGLDDELLLFKKIMDEGVKPETKTLLCMGNHEFINGSTARWEELMARAANMACDVKGFKFIGLSPSAGAGHDGEYQYAIDWYREELAKASADGSEKPIFTFQHYHVTPTVYGSRGRSEDNWGVVDLYDDLQRYPRVINFSGHSHFPINDPRSAWQGIFTAFGTGTLSFFEMGGEYGKYDKHPSGYRDAAQMYIVEVRRDNSVTLKPYDIISGSFFDLVYYVGKPAAFPKETYTDARYLTSSKPEWSAIDLIAARQIIDAETVALQFPQATCPDVVHSYRVELSQKEEVDGKIEWRPLGARYFWSQYYLKAQPKTMTVVLDDLDEETNYRARIVALSAFFKESEQAIEIEFTTPKSEQDAIDKTAPRPDANFLDVQFVDGKPVNRPTGFVGDVPPVQRYGEPQIVADPALDGANAGVFNGRDQFFKVHFAPSDYRKIKKQATFATLFQFDAFPSDSSDVFANSEGAGVGFELKGKDHALEFRASINGSYVRVSAPIAPGKDYRDAFATYDGEDLVLYLDGREVARKRAPGSIAHPSDPSIQTFYVGADVHSDGAGENYFAGRVARARIFTWALSADQIANLHR